MPETPDIIKTDMFEWFERTNNRKDTIIIASMPKGITLDLFEGDNTLQNLKWVKFVLERRFRKFLVEAHTYFL